MLRHLVARIGRNLSCHPTPLSNYWLQFRHGHHIHRTLFADSFATQIGPPSFSGGIIRSLHRLTINESSLIQRNNLQLNTMLPLRHFHAAGSKVHYLDFRYRFNTCHLRTHLLIIRRQKMKKHQRKKFRKRFKCLLAKRRLKREIAKEKAFRVELLTIIKRAEQFDPKEYAMKKIAEINSKPKELTREERLEELKELIRKHRYQVDYIKPKHKRAEAFNITYANASHT